MDGRVIRFEECQDEDMVKELTSKYQADFDRALEGLILGKTSKEDFPGKRIPRRQARGGSNVQYVPGWWFIGQLNALFRFAWDFDVLDINIGQEQLWVKGKLTVKVPGRSTRITYPDGRVEETVAEYFEISKTQFGGSAIKKLKTGGIISISDDLKSAATDCMKKCATLLGLAADIYGKREMLELPGGGSTDQMNALYKIGEDKGMDKEKVNDWVITKHGKRIEELEPVVILGLLAELRGMKGGPAIESTSG